MSQSKHYVNYGVLGDGSLNFLSSLLTRGNCWERAWRPLGKGNARYYNGLSRRKSSIAGS